MCFAEDVFQCSTFCTSGTLRAGEGGGGGGGESLPWYCTTSKGIQYQGNVSPPPSPPALNVLLKLQVEHCEQEEKEKERHCLVHQVEHSKTCLHQSILSTCFRILYCP